MNKLDTAHDFVMNCIKNPAVTLKANDIQNIVNNSWQYADLMQAEADKREPKGFPEVLQPEVDWRLAPKGVYKYKTSNDKAVWFVRDGIYTREVLAPSFGFTGSHVVERPQ